MAYPDMSMRYNPMDEILNQNATQNTALQDKYLNARIDDMKWNKWLTGGGLALGGYNALMNAKQFKVDKSAIDKQNQYYDTKITEINDDIKRKNNYSKQVATL